jgi:hypothetical protein
VNEATIVPFVSNQVLNCLTDVCTDLWLLWWCSSTIMVFAHCWPLMLLSWIWGSLMLCLSRSCMHFWFRCFSLVCLLCTKPSFFFVICSAQ